MKNTQQIKKNSHILYMDYLKLIAKSEEELQRQIQTVKTFSDDIHMEFRLEKYAKITFKRGKLISSQNLGLAVTEKSKSWNREKCTST
jgi:hypothetical protein